MSCRQGAAAPGGSTLLTLIETQWLLSEARALVFPPKGASDDGTRPGVRRRLYVSRQA